MGHQPAPNSSTVSPAMPSTSVRVGSAGMPSAYACARVRARGGAPMACATASPDQRGDRRLALVTGRREAGKTYGAALGIRCLLTPGDLVVAAVCTEPADDGRVVRVAVVGAV